MSVLRSVREVLGASTRNPSRGDDSTAESEGAYWCHDCGERMLDLDVEGTDPPTCPDCGDEMAFEQSIGSTGCAC